MSVGDLRSHPLVNHMNVPTPYENYPPKWGVFDAYAKIAEPKYFDFFSSTGDINRFGARYRVAKSFSGMKLDGFTEPTQRGYSALCHVLLTWSAFEFFMQAIGKKQKELPDVLKRYDTDAWINTIRSADKENRLFKFIYERVNEPHRKELDSYFGADPCNVTYLASAIRHLFAHGALTPNANGAEPDAVINVCQTLRDALFLVMNREFEERMNEFEKMISH